MPSFFIDRPVFAWVVALFICLIGAISIPLLAVAGSLAQKKRLAPSAGSVPTHSPQFVGLLVGVVLMFHRFDQLQGWTDPKILGTAALWVVFALLLYLRYGYHLRGRQLAVLTMVAFVLLVVTLASSHTLVQGGAP